jgi:hypothetical protein
MQPSIRENFNFGIFAKKVNLNYNGYNFCVRTFKFFVKYEEKKLHPISTAVGHLHKFLLLKIHKGNMKAGRF